MELKFGIVAISSFFYNIKNKPATPPNFLASAHFRQACLLSKLLLTTILLFCYTIFNSTRHASGRKATHKSAGLLLRGIFWKIISPIYLSLPSIICGYLPFDIDRCLSICYNRFNSTRQAKATAGLFLGGWIGKL